MGLGDAPLLSSSALAADMGDEALHEFAYAVSARPDLRAQGLEHRQSGAVRKDGAEAAGRSAGDGDALIERDRGDRAAPHAARGAAILKDVLLH